MKKHSLLALSMVAILASCSQSGPKKAPTQTDLPGGGTVVKETDQENYKAAIKNTLDGALTFDGISVFRYDLSADVKVHNLSEETDFGVLSDAEVAAEIGVSVKSMEEQYKTFSVELKSLTFKATVDGVKTTILSKLTLSAYFVEGAEKFMGYFDVSSPSVKSNLQSVAKFVMKDSYDPALFGDTALNLLFGKDRKGYVDLTETVTSGKMLKLSTAPVTNDLIPLLSNATSSAKLELDGAVDVVASLHPTVKKYSDKSFGFAVNSTLQDIAEASGKEDENITGEIGISLKSGKSNGSKNSALEQIEVKVDVKEEVPSEEVRAKLVASYDASVKSNPAKTFDANKYTKDFSEVPQKIAEILKIVNMAS